MASDEGAIRPNKHTVESHIKIYSIKKQDIGQYFAQVMSHINPELHSKREFWN